MINDIEVDRGDCYLNNSNIQFYNLYKSENLMKKYPKCNTFEIYTLNMDSGIDNKRVKTFEEIKTELDKITMDFDFIIYPEIMIDQQMVRINIMPIVYSS